MHQPLHLRRVGPNHCVVESAEAKPAENDPVGSWRANGAADQGDRERLFGCGLTRHHLPRLLGDRFPDTEDFVRVPQLVQAVEGRLHDVKRIAPPDRKSTRLNSSHIQKSRMPSSA